MLTPDQYIALLRPITEKWLAVEAKALATASHPVTASAYKGLLRAFADGALNEKAVLLAGQPVPESGSAPVPSPAPIPTSTPSPGKIDLSNWNVTGDVAADGGFSGTAKIWTPVKEIRPFIIFNADGSITFTARVEGAHTSGSKYARSELRELINGKNAAWRPSQGGMLEAQLKVNEVPKKEDGTPGRIIVGQIHGKNDELCRLYYNDGKLEYVNDKYGDAETEETLVLRDSSGQPSKIPLGEKFTYSILVKNGWLSVSVLHGTRAYTHSAKIGKFWSGPDEAGLYFKAGVYLAVCPKSRVVDGKGVAGTGQGSATFYSIKALQNESCDSTPFWLPAQQKWSNQAVEPLLSCGFWQSHTSEVTI
jgi:hypothetical protein